MGFFHSLNNAIVLQFLPQKDFLKLFFTDSLLFDKH